MTNIFFAFVLAILCGYVFSIATSAVLHYFDIKGKLEADNDGIYDSKIASQVPVSNLVEYYSILSRYIMTFIVLVSIVDIT